MKEFAFIIPLNNEAPYIGRCLESLLLALTKVTFSYEIIVVDNYSTDGSYEIAQQFPVTVLRADGDRPSVVRNRGAKHVNAKYLSFIDGDCLVTEKWIANIQFNLALDTVGAAGGPCQAPDDDNWVVTSWNPTEIKAFYEENSKLPGANFTIKRDVFDTLGGFDELLISAEDDALSKKVIAAGYKCISDSQAANIHLGYPNSLNTIVKKQIWHGATQITSHGLFGDKMTIATMGWLLGGLGLILSTLIGREYLITNALFVFSVLLFVGVPFLFLNNRLKSHKRVTLKKLCLGYVIAFHFVLGRGIGLLKECKMLLFSNAGRK